MANKIFFKNEGIPSLRALKVHKGMRKYVSSILVQLMMYLKLVKLGGGFVHFCKIACRIIETIQEIDWYNAFPSINLIAVKLLKKTTSEYA